MNRVASSGKGCESAPILSATQLAATRAQAATTWRKAAFAAGIGLLPVGIGMVFGRRSKTAGAVAGSLTALLLAECAKEAGLPDGVLNVIPGKGSIAGQALVEHRGVAKIAFTGSTAVGQGIVRAYHVGTWDVDEVEAAVRAAM